MLLDLLRRNEEEIAKQRSEIKTKSLKDPQSVLS